MKKTNPKKTYTLNDGTTGTAEEFCARVPGGGVSPEAMRKRLNTTRNPKRVLMPPEEAKRYSPWRTTMRLELPNTPPPLED